MELITCTDFKAIKVSSMQSENKLTSENLNIICFGLVSSTKSYKTIYEKPKVSTQIIRANITIRANRELLSFY